MSKNEKKYMVPKLRFQEFQGEETWVRGRIGDYLKESRIKGSKGDTAKKITVKLWGNGVFEKQETLRGSENTQYFRRKAGQFIYSKLDFLNQAFGIIPSHLDHYESTADLPCFDVSKKLDTRFLLEYVQRKDFYKKYGEIADGGRIAKRIQVETFLNFPIYLPKLTEQQKIADCLSSLDELIGAEARKLEAYKIHKKGLMQKLFPAEGKTVPEWRFPEFRDAGEWEENTLGGVATFFNGRAYNKGEFLEVGKYKVLRVGNLFSNGEWYYSNLELEENKYCEDGDLLFAWSASFGPRIWRGEKVIYHYHIWKVVEHEGVYKQFLFMLLDYETERMKMKSSNGLGMLHITKGTIESWKCYLPKFAEQQKIADCLSSLDELITAQSQKVEALKTHKKALVQGLFPFVGEEGV
ncbi:restriction endonuclease subunit S [Brevibacillus borstelensis]|uniref:restriction endonuclease subunit S n=1 Tax=Brevibacillus borstelensis TaxID=45462 RepID=UPI00287F9DB8|nr:restriction endonuclease subunit S [Brevibacillus borstelensis]WNF05924.1 restriction endonuclease subunit S [Brevibacillus borstelensis]